MTYCTGKTGMAIFCAFLFYYGWVPIHGSGNRFPGNFYR